MEKFIWVVCYIEISKIPKIENNLARKYKKYKDIQFFVPTVRVVNKTFKKKDHFKQVPLLLNYGFFRVPKSYLANKEAMAGLKDTVGAIYQWLLDPAKHHRKRRIRRALGKYATVTQSEIDLMVEEAKKFKLHSKKQINKLEEGQVITLKNYPFEGMMVEIIKVVMDKKVVRVKMADSYNLAPVIDISFDHIIYTIYNDNYLVSPSKEASLDEMIENGYSFN